MTHLVATNGVGKGATGFDGTWAIGFATPLMMLFLGSASVEQAAGRSTSSNVGLSLISSFALVGIGLSRNSFFALMDLFLNLAVLSSMSSWAGVGLSMDSSSLTLRGMALVRMTFIFGGG